MSNGYYSTWNGYETESLLACGIYQIKQNHKLSRQGPAPVMEKVALDEEGNEYEPQDVLDEVIYYFKSNMFFRTFRMKGAGDRLILFLTHYMHTLIKRLVGVPQEKAKAVVVDLQTSYSVLPTDSSFPFSAFYSSALKGGTAPSAEDAERFLEYSRQLRYELGMRVLERVFQFPESDGTGSKYWLMFAKQQLLQNKK